VSKDQIGEKEGRNLHHFLNNNSVNSVDIDGHGSWSFNVIKEKLYTDRPIDFPDNEITGNKADVTYTLDDQEAKCCDAVKVNRYVRKLFGNGGTVGPFVYDDNGTDSGYKDSDNGKVFHSTGDVPDGPGISWRVWRWRFRPTGWKILPWLFGPTSDIPDYRFSWTQRFRWEAECTAGSNAGKILSTVERYYHSEGHNGDDNNFHAYYSEDRFSFTFPVNPNPSPSWPSVMFP